MPPARVVSWCPRGVRDPCPERRKVSGHASKEVRSMNRQGSTNSTTSATTSLWTYSRGLGRSVVADLIGYQVVATDGEIGHIDAATDELDSAAIVVDTGFWIFDKKRMIPAGVIDRIDADK